MDSMAQSLCSERFVECFNASWRKVSKNLGKVECFQSFEVAMTPSTPDPVIEVSITLHTFALVWKLGNLRGL